VVINLEKDMKDVIKEEHECNLKLKVVLDEFSDILQNF